MTHEDAGHYAGKHPTGTAPDPAAAAALEVEAGDGRITCAAAFEVADALGVSPSEIGKTLDLLEYRITHCQLGLFGYSPDKKIVKAATEVPEALAEGLERVSSDGRLDCASCWKIAAELGMERMAVSAACEGLGLKIGPCQLGAF